jgi:hypothetical protein
VDSHLKKEEWKKKNQSDAFIRRLQMSQVLLDGNLELNERILSESLHRHLHDINHINLFFDHISSIFHEVYSRLITEKNVNIEEIKKEHQEKKLMILENKNNLKKFEMDIVDNCHNIVIGMSMKPFNKIMKEYKSKVDEISDITVKEELGKYPNYREIVDNTLKLEQINDSIQICINQLYSAFDDTLAEKLVEQPLEAKKTNYLDVEGGRDSVELQEDMRKINDCFYSHSAIVSQEDEDEKKEEMEDKDAFKKKKRRKTSIEFEEKSQNSKK